MCPKEFTLNICEMSDFLSSCVDFSASSRMLIHTFKVPTLTLISCFHLSNLAGEGGMGADSKTSGRSLGQMRLYFLLVFLSLAMV